MRDDAWPRGAFLAEFADYETFAGAAAELRRKGYVRVESYTPYRVPEVQRILGHRRSVLPMLVFIGGAAGAVISYAIQYYVNVVSYPLDIGGRPTHAVPAFVIATFEGSVLAAALTAFFGLLLLLRFPRPWHPIFDVDGFERATIDRFWLAIDGRDHRAGPELTPRELHALAAERVVVVEPVP